MRANGQRRPPSVSIASADLDFDWAAVRTFINACKGFIGASSFELPWAMSKAGLLGGMLGLLFFAVIGRYGTLMIVRCAFLLRKHEPTYPDLGLSFGFVGRVVVWVGIIFVYTGAGGSYFVFITKAMSELTISYNKALTPEVWSM